MEAVERVFFPMCKFKTVASAFVLRILRSGGDFAISDTVLFAGVVDMTSEDAEEEAAIM